MSYSPLTNYTVTFKTDPARDKARIEPAILDDRTREQNS